jgi:hypothetical protein
VVCKDGQSIPFHGYYSSGIAAKKKTIQKLQAFLNLSPEPEPVAQQFIPSNPALIPPIGLSAEEEHLTDGVHWRIQQASFTSGSIMRWFSPDVKTSSGFLYLVQKVTGQKTLAEGLLGSASKFFLEQSMKLYGFGPEETPGLDQATLLEPLIPALEPNFAGLTSNLDEARQIITPWLSAPLADWAARFPLKTFQAGQVFGQLVVLFSPAGVYLATLGNPIPEALDELTTLGVQVVKSQ